MIYEISISYIILILVENEIFFAAKYLYENGHVHMYMYIYTYTYIHVHTYYDTRTHVCICMLSCEMLMLC